MRSLPVPRRSAYVHPKAGSVQQLDSASETLRQSQPAPHLLLIDNLFFQSHESNLSIDQRYNLEKNTAQHEIDEILDKINQKGYHLLSEKKDKRETNH